MELVGTIQNVLVVEKGSKGGFIAKTDSYIPVIEFSYGGKEYKKNDPMVVTLLTGKSYIESVIVKQRKIVDPILLTKCINIMRDFTNSMDVPSKEDSFVEYVISVLQAKANECMGYIDNYYNSYDYLTLDVDCRIVLNKKDSINAPSYNYKNLSQITVSDIDRWISNLEESGWLE